MHVGDVEGGGEKEGRAGLEGMGWDGCTFWDEKGGRDLVCLR